jgi:2'-5' RNA ligase
MLSVCSLLPTEYFNRVVDARALVSEDPLLGAIYDPPFAHFTHQLAEEYDWEGLTEALHDFALSHKPFEARVAGVRASTGRSTGIGLGVSRDTAMMAYHTEVWQLVSKFAVGRVDPFYVPESIVPHVTIKRCDTHWQSFGDAMVKLATWDFAWTFSVNSISVQCDPGHNSLTHYQRVCFPLGSEATEPKRQVATNATILSIATAESSPHLKVLEVQVDGCEAQEITLEGPDVVRLMAEAKSSWAHFGGGRCFVEDARVVTVKPNTPHPIAQ